MRFMNVGTMRTALLAALAVATSDCRAPSGGTAARTTTATTAAAAPATPTATTRPNATATPTASATPTTTAATTETSPAAAAMEKTCPDGGTTARLERGGPKWHVRLSYTPVATGNAATDASIASFWRKRIDDQARETGDIARTYKGGALELVRESTCRTTYVSTGFLSAHCEVYGDAGGAHPSAWGEGVNLAWHDGPLRTVRLREVIAPAGHAALVDQLKPRLAAKAHAQAGVDISVESFPVNLYLEDSRATSWFVTKTGLAVDFGEAAGHAVGKLDPVEVPWAKIERFRLPGPWKP